MQTNRNHHVSIGIFDEVSDFALDESRGSMYSLFIMEVISFRKQHPRKVAALGLTAFYLFAMVFLPSLHFHAHGRSESVSACPCSSHQEESVPLSTDEDCDICRILHLAVALYVSNEPVLTALTETASSPLPLFVPVVNELHGVPSCRAPPVVFA